MKEKRTIIPSTKRTEKLHLRLTPDAKRALQAAAKIAHRSVSKFILESALSRSDETLANRRTFNLNDYKWRDFISAPDAPACSLPRIERLLKEPGFFEE